MAMLFVWFSLNIFDKQITSKTDLLFSAIALGTIFFEADARMVKTSAKIRALKVTGFLIQLFLPFYINGRIVKQKPSKKIIILFYGNVSKELTR